MFSKATTFEFFLVLAVVCTVATDGTAQTTAREYCNRGVARQKKGDLAGAMADYTRAIQLDPENGAAYNNRSLVEMAQGDLDSALADCTRALEINPRNIEFRNNRGTIRQKKGDLEGALADFDLAIKLYRHYEAAYRNRADLKMALHDLEGALADYNFAILLNSKDAAAYYNRAQIEAAKGDMEAATADFNRAKKLDRRYASSPPPAINKIQTNATEATDKTRPANLQANNEKHNEKPILSATPSASPTGTQAEPDDIRSFDIEPKNITDVYDHGITKLKKANPKPAAENQPPAAPTPESARASSQGNVANNAVPQVSHVESSPAVTAPTQTASRNGASSAGGPSKGISNVRPSVSPNKLEKAGEIAVNKQEESLNSSLPPVQSRPSQPSTKTQPFKQAEVEVDVASTAAAGTPGPGNQSSGAQQGGPTHKEILPDSSDRVKTTEPEPTTSLGYERRAQFRKSTGDLNGALADYDRAIQLNPRNAAAYNDRGNVKRTRQDLEGALADYSRAIELNGSNASAYYNRGITKQSKGDLDGAIADFNPAIELDPRMTAAYQSRGAVKAMKGDLEGAIADDNRAIELDPKNAATYASRGGLYFLARNWAAALEDFNRFLSLSSENQEYPRLYVWLIRARTGHTDAANKELSTYLEQRASSPDWFSKVAGFLLGKISDADLLAAAHSSDEQKESGQLCEAWFYAGMKKTLRGDTNGAQICFNKSVATMRKDYTEYHFARAELKTLRK